MRKFNAILTVLIIALFLLHAVFGSIELVGAGYNALKFAARAAAFLILIHTVIGAKLTIDTVRVCKKTGAPYFRENRLFWARRISGFAVMVLLFFHMFAFGKTNNGVYQLKPFTTMKMIAQILLALTLAVHILMNVQPMLISFGLRSIRHYTADIWVVISIVILMFIAAFIVYYLRWQAL